jgi:formylglycine-generating enzyme required for sulfatase activity
MGIAGGLNDAADIPAPVFSFLPNDNGLYNMAGNVNEWVMDVYRPYTPYDANDFNTFRGNEFMKDSLDEENYHVDKDSVGRVIRVPVSVEENVNRLNYRRSDVINFLDGDTASWVTYNYGVNTLINDKARVYKGGSWSDRAYYLIPGTRRYLDENQSTATIGFRCAMARLGSPLGNEDQAGNFPSKKYPEYKRKKP